MGFARTVMTGILLTLVTGSGSATAQEPIRRVSLEQAVALATRENFTLRAKGFEVEAVRANEITAALRPNPVLTYLAEQWGNMGDPQHTANISQLIETGGKRRRRIESARTATRVVGYDLADLRRQIVLQTENAFVGVLAAQAALTLAEQNLRTIDEVEQLQRVRAERGDISDLELTRIQVQRFAFERDALDAGQALRTAKIALRAVAGPDRIAEEFDVAGELEFRDVAYPGPDLYQVALANRPDLRSVEAAREKARADINLARANASWDFSPLLEYQRIGQANTAGFGVNLPLRIFDRNQGEMARTLVEADRVEEVRRAILVQIRADVQTALAATEEQRRKVLLLRDTYLPKARQARETVEYAYRRGGLALLDFLDAQRAYRDTALEHVRALANYWTGVYQLEAALGTSLEK